MNKNTFRRLLTYAKPYIVPIVISLALLLSVIVVDLVRPLVIGRAVDGIINKFNKVYTIVDKPTSNSVAIGNYNIELGELSDRYATIVYNGEKGVVPYYLAVDITKSDIKRLSKSVKIENVNNDSYIKIDDNHIRVIELNKDIIKELRSNDINSLIKISIIFIALLIMGLILNFGQTMILNHTGQKIIYNIRSELLSHVDSLSLKFFSHEPVGKLVTRITNDTETLNELYTNVIVDSIKSVIMLIGISIMMFSLSPKLTLLIFTIVPFIVLITLWFRKVSRKVYSEVRTRIALINTFLSEHISGMKVVQVFGQEQRKFKEFDKENILYYKAGMKQLHMFGIFRPTMYFLYIVGLSIVLIYGSNQVLNDIITLGTMLIFVQYISNFFDPIQQLAEQFDSIQSAIASAEKIFTLLDTKPDIIDSDTAIELENVKGNIEFKSVWFAYEGEDWILKDVSFKVNPGETVAFVGATGAGKTSILNLITRYYDIQKGQILIDGVDIKDIKISSLRNNIGQMLQDVFLFTGDIKSNIRLNNDHITDEEIIQAAEYVNADRFIQKLPNKYNEKVYEGGTTYSAGERQLLSFARTLANKPAVLILDEATANIDTETEQLIQDALVKLMKGRTTLVVAHRLSTIQHADKIIVLHKGRIKEVGNHQELLAKKGVYYQLYELQYSSQ